MVNPQDLLLTCEQIALLCQVTAINEIRKYIVNEIGKEYLPPEPRIYKSKAKNAQEAHECIRPTNINLSPQKIRKLLNIDEYKLYEIIWQRALSSQMTSAIINQVSVDIKINDNQIIFRANGSSIKFKGMLAVYKETKRRR